MKNTENFDAFRLSFRHILRLVFVLFSLYLLGDAFSRWDGFSYYASFSDFLPALSLASILWSIVAVFAAFSVWAVLSLVGWFSARLGLTIKFEYLFFLTVTFVLFGALAWKGKKVLWPDADTSLQIKLTVLACVILATVIFTIKSRDKIEKWLNVIQDRITPLVWIFGMFVLLSVPLVVYYAYLEDSGQALSKKAGQDYFLEGTRPNIILITFDALAAREMSLYGYHKETTPFLKKWAEKGTVFTRAEAESNFTASAVASLMTGKRVWTHQTYHIDGSPPVRSDIESLPFVLKDKGYFNIALVVNPFASVKVLGMNNSFDIAPPASEFGVPASLFGWKFGVIDILLYRAFGEKIKLHNWILRNDFLLTKFINLISRNISQTTVPPGKVFDRFLDIADNNIRMPFFAWIHLFPPHDPYLPPEPFRGRFSTSQEMRTYKQQEKIIEYSYKYLFQFETVPEKIKPAINLFRKYYDEYVAYIDNQFKNFIRALDKKNINNTVLILSADHGESFDHGYFTHGGPFLYEQVTHIPLIIKEPGQNWGQVEDTLVEQIDIPATVLDFAGISRPSWMEGRSLIPLLRGQELPERTSFSMNLEGNRSRGHRIERGSIAMWDGDYKFIHYLERDESLLFNIKDDPDELVNLIDEEPEICMHLLTLIKNNLKAANERIKMHTEQSM